MRGDEKLVEQFHERLRAAEVAIEFVERFDESNGWYSSKAQLTHAMLELKAALDGYDAAKLAHDRLYR